jgi:hypothetical protein
VGVVDGVHPDSATAKTKVTRDRSVATRGFIAGILVVWLTP